MAAHHHAAGHHLIPSAAQNQPDTISLSSGSSQPSTSSSASHDTGSTSAAAAGALVPIATAAVAAPVTPWVWPGSESQYTATYDDRELAPSQPRECLWLGGRASSQVCGRKYPSLEHLYRHVMRAHLDPMKPKEEEEKAPVPAQPRRGRPPVPKPHSCKLGNCHHKLTSHELLVRHVQEYHFARFTYACQFRHCIQYRFNGRDERNDHHSQNHRAQGQQNADKRQRVLMSKKSAWEDLQRKPTFAQSFPALHNLLETAGSNRDFEKISPADFGESVEVPFWVEFLLPINRVEAEKPAEDRAKAINPDPQKAQIQHSGGLTRRAPTASMKKAEEVERESASEREDDLEHKEIGPDGRWRAAFRRAFHNPFGFDEQDGYGMRKKHVKLMERPSDGRFPVGMPELRKAALPRSEVASVRKRTYKHPLLADVDDVDGPEESIAAALESSTDDGDTTDAQSIGETEKWLEETKTDYMRRKLTRKRWRNEQRQLRRLLYPDLSEPDTDSDADEEDSKSATGVASPLQAIKRSPGGGQLVQQGASNAVAGPSRLEPTQLAATRIPNAYGIIKSDLNALPSIPKKVLPPAGTTKRTPLPGQALSPAKQLPNPGSTSTPPRAPVLPFTAPKAGLQSSAQAAPPPIPPKVNTQTLPRAALPSIPRALPTAMPSNGVQPSPAVKASVTNNANAGQPVTPPQSPRTAAPLPPRPQQPYIPPQLPVPTAPPRTAPIPPPPTAPRLDRMDVDMLEAEREDLSTGGFDTRRLTSSSRFSPPVVEKGGLPLGGPGSFATARSNGAGLMVSDFGGAKLSTGAGGSGSGDGAAKHHNRSGNAEASALDPLQDLRKTREDVEQGRARNAQIEQAKAEKMEFRGRGACPDDAIAISDSDDSDAAHAPERKKARLDTPQKKKTEGSSKFAGSPGQRQVERFLAAERLLEASSSTFGSGAGGRLSDGASSSQGSTPKFPFGPASRVAKNVSAGRYGHVDPKALAAFTGSSSSSSSSRDSTPVGTSGAARNASQQQQPQRSGLGGGAGAPRWAEMNKASSKDANPLDIFTKIGECLAAKSSGSQARGANQTREQPPAQIPVLVPLRAPVQQVATADADAELETSEASEFDELEDSQQPVPSRSASAGPTLSQQEDACSLSSSSRSPSASQSSSSTRSSNPVMGFTLPVQVVDKEASSRQSPAAPRSGGAPLPPAQAGRPPAQSVSPAKKEPQTKAKSSLTTISPFKPVGSSHASAAARPKSPKQAPGRKSQSPAKLPAGQRLIDTMLSRSGLGAATGTTGGSSAFKPDSSDARADGADLNVGGFRSSGRWESGATALNGGRSATETNPRESGNPSTGSARDGASGANADRRTSGATAASLPQPPSANAGTKAPIVEVIDLTSDWESD